MARGPHPKHVISLTAQPQAELKRLTRLRERASYAQVGRAKIVLLAYEHLPARWGAPTGPSANGAAAGGKSPASGRPLGPEPPAFFPSVQRAQITALACTLPEEFGKPLARWSSAELAKAAQAKDIVSHISASTIRKWLREDRIKPWQHRFWQKPTDPRFLEKATGVLNLSEHAHTLAKGGEILVCADEKTCLQALKIPGGVQPARPGKPLRVSPRYQGKGILNLFAGLLVHRGETIARCFERKRFLEFQTFLAMIFKSLWTKKIRVLHLSLDNGSPHAPQQLEAWINSLQLPFEVHGHWLPVNASWLDQVEIVFSPLQQKGLIPKHFESPKALEERVMRYVEEYNKDAKPIQWSYTSVQLCQQFALEQPRELVPS